MQKQFHRMSVATTRLIKGSDARDPSSVNDLGHWDSRDSNSEFGPLTNAMVATSQAMETISKEWGSHVRSYSCQLTYDKRALTLPFFVYLLLFFSSSKRSVSIPSRTTCGSTSTFWDSVG